MDYRPLTAYLICLALYRAAERIALIRAGSLKHKPKSEPTMYLIVGSFVLAMIGPAIEYWWIGANPGPASYLMGGALLLLGLFVRIRAIVDLGKDFSMAVEVREGHHLVETGIYGRIRHPLYLGVFLLFIACPAFLNARWSFLISAAGLVVLYLRIRKEEAYLAGNLPGYREYMNRTSGMLPGIW